MTDAGIASDSLGGTQMAGNDSPSNSFSRNQDKSDPTISAGYGNNVDQPYEDENSGSGKKEGFMSKIKDKMLPKGPGKTDFGNDPAATAAQHVNSHHADRSVAASNDLNRE